MMKTIELLDHDFEAFEHLQKHQRISTAVGAQSVFVGYMRDFRGENKVDKMVLYDYPPMTEQQLHRLADSISERYQLLDLYVGHRLGEVLPTSPLVVIAATAVHRGNAMAAVNDMLEEVKYHIPLWKKEYHNNHYQWVEGNTDKV